MLSISPVVLGELELMHITRNLTNLFSMEKIHIPVNFTRIKKNKILNHIDLKVSLHQEPNAD